MFKLEIPKQKMEVILHLSRNHHEAPAKLEVIKPREKYTYETRRYTLIDGIWLPAVVECETHTPVGHTKATYVLLKAEKNQFPLQLPELPTELPVRQWHGRPELGELTIDETTTSTAVNVPASIKWGDLKKNIENQPLCHPSRRRGNSTAQSAGICSCAVYLLHRRLPTMAGAVLCLECEPLNEQHMGGSACPAI